MCNNAMSRLTLWGTAVPVLFSAMACQAEPGFIPGSDPLAVTVQQMLAIDTRLALKKELQLELEARGLKAEPPSQPLISTPAAAPVMAPVLPAAANQLSAPATAQSEAPKKPKRSVLILDGIFGKGGQLYADVFIDGQRVRYKRDQRSPLGYDSFFAYQLVSINVPCVHLKTQTGPRKICIDERGE